jgi:hypothetical protein
MTFNFVRSEPGGQVTGTFTLDQSFGVLTSFNVVTPNFI